MIKYCQICNISGWTFITHPFEVAHCLEIDQVAFARVQWGVPVAIVCVVVSDSEGLWQAAGWQLGCVVVRCASCLSLTMRHGQREALLKPQLPLHFLHSFLFNHHLVCAGNRVDMKL